MDILKKFNLSYSTYSTYKESQLVFFFNKIMKAQPSDDVPDAYGAAGNVTHDYLENTINKAEANLDKLWEEWKVDEKRGIGTRKLSKDTYKPMIENGKRFIDSLLSKKGSKYVCEEEWTFDTKEGLHVRGFIDVVEYTEDGKIKIYDWKTNSQNSYSAHRLQRLFYSWLCYKSKGIIPEQCMWVYLKQLKWHKDSFTLEDVQKFDIEIQKFIDDIIKKGDKIENYEIGDINSLFNEYKSLCQREIGRREGNILNNDTGGEVDWTTIKTDSIRIIIQNNFCFLEGNIPEILLEGIDRKLKYNLKNKYWMQRQAMQWNRGIKPANYDDIGTTHLFDKSIKRFSLGSLEKVKEIINQYASYKKIDIEIKVEDRRNKEVRKKLGIMPKELIGGRKLRDYQQKAVDIFIEKGMGFLEMATGSGKTITTAEIIRRLDTKTLWIIDKKELLHQTKESFEKDLGIEIGIIGDGKVDIKDVTVSTIQTLNSKIDKLDEYLKSINLVICDESHHASSEIYEKVFKRLRNTEFRCGTTATAQRDDGNAPVMFSLIGDIIYKISTEYLIEKGFLMKPKVHFYKVKTGKRGEEYSEDYQKSVVENNRRNMMIKYISENIGAKVLILTKIVDHGHFLNSIIPNSKFIHGSLNSKDRKKYMDEFKESKESVLIVTVSIAAEGLDIPDLDMIINACANKSDVKSIQILGRILRKIEGKEDALYVDFIDEGKYSRKHSIERMKILRKEGHEVSTLDLEDGLLDIPKGYFD